MSDLQLHSATGANTGAPSTLAGGFEWMNSLGYGPLDEPFEDIEELPIPVLDDGGAVVADSPAVVSVPSVWIPPLRGEATTVSTHAVPDAFADAGKPIPDPRVEAVVADSPVVGPVPESRGAEVAGRILTGRPLWAHRSLIAAAEARHALPVGMLAAIAVLESGGGTYVCHGNPHNAYGYGSCPGPPFATPEEAAERVAATLAGYSKYAGAHERLGIYNAGATGYAAGNGHAYADQALGIMEAAQ